MAEFVAPVTGELYKDGKTMIGYFHQQYRSVKNLDDNYKRMKDEADKLYARRKDINDKIDGDKTKQATNECKVWLNKVMNIEEGVIKLEKDYEKEKKHQIEFARLYHRSKLSKRIAEKCDQLYHCWAEGEIFLTVPVVEKPPERAIKMEAPKIEDKPSIYLAVDAVKRLLLDEKVRKVGLWGMLGVGKTAIMQNLNNMEEIGEMFDIVIFATLTEECDEEKMSWVKVKLKRAKENLQCEIAQRLKLNLEGTTDTKKIASKISEKLECKRYLLLLDHVWADFNLDDIGICDNGKDSKVVLASRDRQILNTMDVDDLVDVNPLSKLDALALFREKVGQNVNFPDFEKVAQSVVKECSNLPLLITSVARFFKRRENADLWWDGLRRFRKWPNVKFQGMDEVLELLTFCYKDLDDEDKRRSFLYSALYTKGCKIYEDYLVECWRAEGFIDNVGRGRHILDDLIDVCLLERGEKMKHVRMKKIFQDMALKILSQGEDSKVLMEAGKGLRKPPNSEAWKQARRISLMDNELEILPERLECTYLSTLLLQRNVALKEIPELFFGSMQNLRVLDLHGTKVTALPSSLSCLTCLRALYLNSCDQLMKLPSNIDALRHLELLDIRGTNIHFLPTQIGYLSQLRCLRVSLSKSDGKSNISAGMKTYQNVFSNLPLLEELVIEVDPDNQWWNDVARGIIEEVATLLKLTSLLFCFPDVDCLKIFTTTSSLWKDPCFKFQFSVSQYCSTRYKVLDYFEFHHCRYLKHASGEGLDSAISELLAETNAFELIEHKGALRLSDFGIENINKLKSCLIEGCKDIETIIDGNGKRGGVLESLEKMSISNLPNLQSIWEGPVPAGNLAELTTLILSKCSKLKSVFSIDMLQQLSKLQHLEVEECHEIEEIFTGLRNNGLEPVALPSLKILILHDLPKLRSISTSNSLSCPSLERSEISGCPLLPR